MSVLALFSLVDSEVTRGTICGLKQVSPKLQQLMVALSLQPADGWSGNIAAKVSGDLSAACCCGVSLGLESSSVGGNQILDSEGLRPACWHHSVTARGGGSPHRLPSCVTQPGPNPAGCWGSQWWVPLCATTPLTASSAVPCCQLLVSSGC